MRLIDADALFDQLECYQRKLHDADRELTANQCIAFVENAPTVDAVPRERWEELRKTIVEFREKGKKMRLIDADALKEAIEKERFSGWGNCCVELDDAPTVDAVPVRHARWLVNEKMRWIVCSACGTNVPVVAGWCMDAHINFCPNCGAKMDEERREE